VITRSKAFLIVEFALIFMGIPLGLYLLPARIPPIPVLWASAAYCLIVLSRDKTFPRAELWRASLLRNHISEIMMLFVPAAILVAAFVWRIESLRLFDLVKANSKLWALVMLFYPVFSVYPQGIIFRSFVLHRYSSFFNPITNKRRWSLILLSALTFSFMHIVFRNPVAVALTFIGGMLFAHRHLKSGSLFVSSFEHGLYGCLLFTIGLGSYFYVRFV
jgi:hypothetical protein